VNKSLKKHSIIVLDNIILKGQTFILDSGGWRKADDSQAHTQAQKLL
jgi:hypothetical protein